MLQNKFKIKSGTTQPPLHVHNEFTFQNRGRHVPPWLQSVPKSKREMDTIMNVATEMHSISIRGGIPTRWRVSESTLYFYFYFIYFLTACEI